MQNSSAVRQEPKAAYPSTDRNGKEPLSVVGGCTLTPVTIPMLVRPSRFVQCYMLALCIGLEISAG